MKLEIKNHDGGFIIFDADSEFTYQSYTQRHRNFFDEMIFRINLHEELIEALNFELSNRENTWDAEEKNSGTFEAIQKLKALIQKSESKTQGEGQNK